MKNKKHDPRLNFYSFLLSYLTLKKYHGSVTMYTNQSAHRSLIKHIPYDNIVLMENKNKFDFWNKYKLDAMEKVNGDVIPYNLVLKYGLNRASDISKYTHMWFDSKFDSKNIGLLKNKVRKEFPDSYHLIEKYDRDIMRK